MYSRIEVRLGIGQPWGVGMSPLLGGLRCDKRIFCLCTMPALESTIAEYTRF